VWWSGEDCFFDTGLLPRGHEARKIIGVGEEGKDQIDWIGKPLLGVIGVTHGWLGYNRSLEKLRVRVVGSCDLPGAMKRGAS